MLLSSKHKNCKGYKKASTYGIVYLSINLRFGILKKIFTPVGMSALFSSGKRRREVVGLQGLRFGYLPDLSETD